MTTIQVSKFLSCIVPFMPPGAVAGGGGVVLGRYLGIGELPRSLKP